MLVQRSSVDVVIRAPAKLNLFFEVLAKRNDGYHEIETLICPIDLYDTLYFRKEPSGQVDLQCDRVPESGRSDGKASAEPWVVPLPAPRENIALRAAELLRRQAGADCGAALRLVKRIPISAGLGGGSSDAAATLVAANDAWNLRRSPSELAAAACELGSDVPFFLVGGPAVCRGRGERVEPVVGLGGLHFVVASPPDGLSTAAVYAACRPASQPRPLEPLLESLLQGDVAQAGRLFFNRLQPSAEGLSPWIKRLRRQFEDEDCLGHGMSGSGTSYYGLCRHARQARRVARRIQANGVGSVFAVRICR